MAFTEPFLHKEKPILITESWTSLHPRLIAGFSTKLEGESRVQKNTLNLGLHVGDSTELVLKNREKAAALLGFSGDSWVCAEQVHDHHIQKVGQRKNQDLGFTSYDHAIKGADGLYTDQEGLLLALCYADCVPLYFFAGDRNMIGAAHAGWKGSVGNIGGKMVDIWREEENISPETVFVIIGPSIGSCCYEVDDYVKSKADSVLFDKKITNPPYLEKDSGKYALDLKELNRQLLIASGVKKEHIITSSLCTSCEDNLFFSHRRDNGHTGRMMSFIGISKEDKEN
ncbi:peptidoglycan editing factor PgeF [Bacillus lacus]|uniref:Purine nucleoside phosphorylase n=1 Tax=Metabacillus lacus TaxID=1983721 RepID=A0A7X2J138_9BACI|nr:peptidoglycan editing factor PgeF [Metabacillus lacus]MRX73319.1 peptidoglycan editing factor PgeF [Metabacillus lacus]